MATLDELSKAHKEALNKWGSLKSQTNDQKAIGAARDKANVAGEAWRKAAEEDRKKKQAPGQSLASRLLGGL